MRSNHIRPSRPANCPNNPAKDSARSQCRAWKLFEFQITSERKRPGSLPTNQRNGIAAVEAALCFPILILVTLLTLDCCSCIFLRQSLTVAAFEGARVAIVPSAQQDNVVQQVKNTLAERGINQVTVTTVPANLAELPPGTIVSVQVDANPNQNVPIYLGIFQNKTMSARVAMITEF